jgi:hypothetical protein
VVLGSGEKKLNAWCVLRVNMNIVTITITITTNSGGGGGEKKMGQITEQLHFFPDRFSCK